MGATGDPTPADETTATGSDGGAADTQPSGSSSGKRWTIALALGATALVAATVAVAVSLPGTPEPITAENQPTPTPEVSEFPIPETMKVFKNPYLDPDGEKVEEQAAFNQQVQSMLPTGTQDITFDILQGMNQQKIQSFWFDRDGTSAEESLNGIMDAPATGWSVVHEPVCSDHTGVMSAQPDPNTLVAINAETTQICSLPMVDANGERVNVFAVASKGELDGQIGSYGGIPETGRAYVDIPPFGVVFYVSPLDSPEQMQEGVLQDGAQGGGSGTGSEPVTESTPEMTSSPDDAPSGLPSVNPTQ